MIAANLSEIEKTTQKALKYLSKVNARSVPYATRYTLTNTAYRSQQEAQKRAENEFINRNKYTKKSIQYRKADGLNLKRMTAYIGSTADYMRIQEEGGISKTTSVPALGARVSKSERKMVSKSKYLQKLGVIKGKYTKKGSRGSQYVAKLYAGLKEKKAVKIGNSLYQVNSIRRMKGRVKPKITRLYAVDKRLRVKPVKILRKSVIYATSGDKVKREFLHNLSKQIKRLR